MIKKEAKQYSQRTIEEEINCKSCDKVITSFQVSITLLQDLGHVEELIAMDRVLTPWEEQVDDNPDEFMETIVGTYSLEEDREYETDEKEILIPQVKDKDAQETLTVLRRYAKQQEQGNVKLMKQLDIEEEAINAWSLAKKQQTNITSYFL